MVVRKWVLYLLMFCGCGVTDVMAQTLVGAQFRKTHAAAGIQNIPIDITQTIGGAVSVEPRDIGAGHQVVFVFDVAITSIGAATAVDSVGSPSGTVNSATFSGNEVVVTLTGIPDSSRINVAVSGVNGATTATVAVGFLLGDVNNSRTVDSTDAAAVKLRSGLGVGASGAWFDLNASGFVNAADISATKSNLGAVLPQAGEASLHVILAGNGTGTVASSLAGISCPSGCMANYALNSTVTLTASPGAGSTFSGWSGGCSGVASTTGVTLLQATDCTATFTLNSYLVNGVASPVAGGNVICSSPVNHGSTSLCTATANAGYTLTSISGCGGTPSATSPYTTGPVTAACTVTASFSLNSYAVTGVASPIAGGSVSCTSPTNHGATSNCTITVNTGYTLTGVSGCGGTPGTTSPYTTGAVTAACSVTATLTLKTYTVTPSASANGTITPNTAQTVSHGSTRTFTVTPSAGYVATVGGTCGGTLSGTTYTTNAITASCTVSAAFNPQNLTVTPSAGANGVISPSTPQSVPFGTTRAFTVTPNANYTASVGGTCGGTLSGTTYTTNIISASCTVAATFVRLSYTVTPSAGTNGTISPTTAQSVLSGATKAFTVTPAAGYSAVMSGTCGGTLSGTTFTTSPISGNCSVVASFASTAPKYVSSTGNDTTGTGTQANPWKTIAKGISTMVSGETLIIRNGTYTGTTNFIRNVPSGTAAKPTSILAESPMQVRIQSSTSLAVADNQVSIGGNYIKVDGFIFDMAGSINPAFIGTITGGFNTLSRSIFKRAGDIDSSGGLLSITGSDNLIEDVAGVGACRYCFTQGGINATTQRNIWRRVIGRFDYSNSTLPKATFATEGSSTLNNVRDHLYQNVIAIDGQNPGNLGGSEKMGGFYVSSNTANVTFQGSMVINEGAGSAGALLRELGSNNSASNVVVWDVQNSLPAATGIVAGTGDSLTVGGNITGAATDLLQSATNSLLKPAINPANLLNNTPGAVVMKQYGVSGTRWGQAGYNTLTTTDLWPWPYQDAIRSVFREFNNVPAGNSPAANNTTRGFGATGNGLYGGPIGLTSYIWEYLGVPCPAAACPSPSTVSLAWDPVSAYPVAGYRLYFGTTPRVYAQSFGQGIAVGTATSYSVVGLPSGVRYYFTVTAFDAFGQESDYSNEVFKDVP